MPYLDQLLPLGLLITQKVGEAFLTEKLKNWVNKSNEKTAKKSLIELYQQLSILEQTSLKFIETFDLFVVEESRRRRFFQRTHEEEDFRWYVSWGSRILHSAEEVAQQLEVTTNVILKLKPKFEIYLPDVVDFLEIYKSFALPIEINNAVYIKTYKPMYHDPTIGQHRITALKIRGYVDELARAKKALADFIAAEFKFKEL